jgi:hypothetical protein
MKLLQPPWRRSVLFSCNLALQKSIQAELTSRYPQTKFPLNMAVVGVKDDGYHALIQVYDFETGIDENVNAPLGDLLGSIRPEAAVIAMIDHVIARLRESGKVPNR